MPREPLVVELGPVPEPWEVARRLGVHSKTCVVFIDSAGGPRDLARYSYLAAGPTSWIESRGLDAPDPFEAIAEQLRRFHAVHVAGLPPFQGGVAGLFGYGLCQRLERLPRPQWDEFHTPELAVGVYGDVIAWDHDQNRAWFISHALPDDENSHVPKPGTAQARARRRAEQIVKFATEPALPFPPMDDARIDLRGAQPLLGFANVFSNFSRAGFEAAIGRAVEYTHAGDCFQVNIAQRLVTPLREHPLALYGRLRRVNPAPFAAYFDAGSFQVASASPERFIKMSHDGQIETRPIKGTRSRGYTPEHDAALHGDLLESEKDRAENIMIVDLLRNDLGRVCEYGSVQVSELCRLESYSTVHHLVSEVRGQLREGLTAIDLLKAAFPGGSVSGAPKVRAMEIIAELEPHARGPYCGCLGWIGFDGAMDTNILIRTFTAAGGWLQFPVGGGIVADSDPQREYEETLHKAAGLLRALEEP